MIKELVQSTLDNMLYPKNVYVYEQRKIGVDSDSYVVYSLSGQSREYYADDKAIIKKAGVTVKYYYRTEMLESTTNKEKVRETEQLIETALEEAGFSIPFGKFDAGDVDDIGYYTTIFECEYSEVVYD